MVFIQGNGDFEQFSKPDSFYCDKTLFIKTLEEENRKHGSIMFLRPRRFGKSLFLSTLKYFHDLRYKDRYQELFGHLNIFKEKNIIHNSYMVLLLNFSSLNISGVEMFEDSIKKKINNEIRKFKAIYSNFQTEQIIVDSIDPISSFTSLINFIEIHHHKIYVLIDEYDSQVNQLFSDKESVLNKYLVQNHKKEMESMNSTYRRFFSELKAAVDVYPNIKTFITGVTPIALQAYGSTSGYNISRNVSHSLRFAELCGIKKDDVKRAIGSLKHVNLEEKLNLEKVIYENYNGYYFHHQVGGLINPTLFCYIMEAVQENLRIPKLLKDENVSISENAAVRVILQNAHSEPVLKQLIISGKYKLNKPLESKLDCLELMEDEHSLVQYIYYMGGLTRVKDNENILVIPNKIAKQEYFEEILKINRRQIAIDSCDDLRVAINDLVQKNNIKPLCEIIIRHKLLHLKLNNVVHSKEQDVKTAFMFALSLGGFEKQVQNEHYIQKYNKSIDLFIQECSIHFEFKNITIDELDLTTSMDCSVKTAESEKLKTKTKAQLFPLKVTKTFDGRSYATTVKHIWEGLLEQTKENKNFLEEIIQKKIISYVVLRVGLYVLIDEKII